MSDELFAALRQSVIDGDAAQAAALAQQALDDGVPPLDAIDDGLVPGLSYVGEQFGLGELFLPDMMLAARAMQKAMAILEPELAGARPPSATSSGRVVIGTVKGDIHEIGKNLVGHDALDQRLRGPRPRRRRGARTGSSRRRASTTRTSSACRRS